MNLMEGKERKKSNPNIGSATDDPTKWSREPVFSKASPYDYDESSEDENGAELLARIQRKKSERQEILDKSMSLSFSKSHSNSISNSGNGNGCSLDESAQMLKAHDQGLINSMIVVSNQNGGFSKSFNTVTTPSQQQASSGQINGHKLMVSQSEKNINIGPNAQNAKFVPPLEIHSDNNSHNSSSPFINSDTAFPTLYLPGNGKSLSGSYSNSDVENSPRDHEKNHFLSDKSGENTPKRNDILSGVAAGYVYNNSTINNSTSGSNSNNNNSNNDRVNHNNININSASSSRKNSNSNISLSQIPSHPHPQGTTTTQPKQARSIQRVVSVQNNNNSGGNNHIHNYSSNNSNVGSNHYTSGNTSGSRSPVGPMGTAEQFTNHHTSHHTTGHTNNHISHRDKLNKVDKLTENAQLNPSADIAKLISIGLSETEAIKVYNEHVNALNNQNKNAHISYSSGINTHIAHNNINNSNSCSINYPTPLPTQRDSLSIQVPSSRNPIDSYLDDIPIVSAPVPVNRNLAEERQAHEQQYRSHQNRHNHSSGRSLRRQNTDFNATAAANALSDINSGNNNTVNSNNSNNTTTNSYNNSDNRVEYRGDSNSVSTSSSRRSSKNNNVINQNVSNNSNSGGCGGGNGSGSGTVSRPYTANNIESVRINSRYNLNAASGSSSNLGEYFIAEQSPYHSRKNSLTHNMNSTGGLDRMLSQSANNTPRGGVSAQIKNVIAGNEALTERDLINISMNSYGLSESEWDSGSNNSSFYSSFSQNSNANTYNNNQLLSAAVQYANHNRSMSSMNNLSPHSPHPGHGIGFNTSGRNSNLSNQDSNNSNNDDNSPPRIRLSHSADEQAFQLGLLLSKQDAAFGINMFSDTNLIESNEVEINAMMSAGYAKEHAIQMIFERIYGTCE